MLLYQPESGYCYNSDSLYLYDFINSFAPHGRVLDVGAGCGIVGLLVARDNKNIELEAVEKQPLFVEYARKNAACNEIAYNIYESDFLVFSPQEKYDFIVSNPPFYPEGVQKSQNEMIHTARYNVHLPLEPFFKKVSQLLKPHSHFIFCYDATVFGLLCTALERVKLRVVDVRFVHSRLDKAASLVLVHARNGSRSLMKVLPPLVSFEGDLQSFEALKIFEKSQTKSIKCTI